jgi:RNA polymerase sigma-70 factor, ECF subfamily
MTSIELRQRWAERDPVVAAATAGDRSAFAQLVVRHRRELLAHAYRMLGSIEDAEDLTQETFLRCWNKRESFQGRASFRAWLYRIATNACLTAIARQQGGRRASAQTTSVETDWLLEGLATSDASPDAVVVSNETVELALLVAIHHLPTRQRTVLVLRDVLGWSAKDAADLLESSVASVNSMLQRARATLREHLTQHRLEWARVSDASTRVGRRASDAAVRGEAPRIVARRLAAVEPVAPRSARV